MNETIKSVAAPPRVVVINLDPVWPFAQLVRQHALDIFADPRKRHVIQFRTTGAEASDNEGARPKVWGVQRPRFYGDDLDSLVADIAGDIDDLEGQRISRLVLIFVADLTRSTDDTFDVMRRIEAHVSNAQDDQDIRRYFCFRHETKDEKMAHVQSELATLLYDQTRSGRQLANNAFALSPAQLIPRSENAHAMSFRLLRCVIDLTSDASDAGAIAEGASPARQLLAHPRPLLLLQPSGFTAATTSAEIAQIFSGYVAKALLVAADNREAGRGNDPTAAKVNEVLDRIVSKITGELHNWDSVIGPIEKAESRVKELPTEFNTLRAVKLWWRSGVERMVEEKTRSLPNELEKSLAKRLDLFRSARGRTQENIAGPIDEEIRDLISQIPIVSGGVAGGITDEIERLTIKIKGRRKSLQEQANLDRAKFMYALEAKEQAGESGIAKEQAGKAITLREVPALEDIAIDRIDAGLKMKALIPRAGTAYQGLIPLAYPVVMALFGVGCLVTVAAHSLAKAEAEGVALVYGFYFSTALYTSAILATAFSFAWLFITASRRRSAFISVIDELNEAHDAAWLVLEKILSHGSRYVAVSRQIFFFDVLLNEIERRTGEADRDALNLALVDIGAPAGDAGTADNFYQDMAAQLSVTEVSRWIRTMLDSDQLFLRAIKQPNILSFDLDETGGRQRRGRGSSAGNQMATTTFAANQTVRVVPIEVSESSTTEKATT